MFVARWQIDARFGHKQTAIDLLRRWEREVGRQAGTGEMEFRILTGSVGARESTIEANHSVDSIAQLESFFAAIGKIEAHQQWARISSPISSRVRRCGTSIALRDGAHTAGFLVR